MNTPANHYRKYISCLPFIVGVLVFSCVPACVWAAPIRFFPDISHLAVMPVTKDKLQLPPRYGDPYLRYYINEGIDFDINPSSSMQFSSENPLFLPPDLKPEPGEKCIHYDITITVRGSTGGPDPAIGMGWQVACKSDYDPGLPGLPVGYKITYGAGTCAHLPGHILACTNGTHHIVFQPNDPWWD